MVNDIKRVMGEFIGIKGDKEELEVLKGVRKGIDKYKKEQDDADSYNKRTI